MTTEEMIEVMKGHPEEVEHYINSIDDAEERILLRTYWTVIKEPVWNWRDYEYRVKPEKKVPVYRRWKGRF